MASLREKLAVFILQGDHTILEWTTFQKQIPNLQLKTVSQGRVLISFNGEDFEQPSVWLSNFQNRCIERFEAEKRKLSIVLPEERLAVILSADENGRDAEQLYDEFAHVLEQYDWNHHTDTAMPGFLATMSKAWRIPSKTLISAWNLWFGEWKRHQ